MNIASAVTAWVAVHPYQTALHVVNGVILLTPAAVTAPIFSALGFTASGPAAGMSLFYYNELASGGQLQRLSTKGTNNYAISQDLE